MENFPYTGVTGFMSGEEVEKILAVFPKNSKRRLMVGVLASTTTVNGERPSRFYGRYPVIDDIKNIFPSHPLAFNVIHFNDKTRDDEQILQQMLTLTEKGGENFHGFQLNIKWPNPKILTKYRAYHPKKKIILQIGSGAFRAVYDTPALMAEKIIGEYSSLIDYVLIDPSGGKGLELDTETTFFCLLALEVICDIGIGFGVAGGLCADNTNKLLRPIAKAFHYTSTDAEGKLRDWNEGDMLNIERTVEYVRVVNKLFPER